MSVKRITVISNQPWTLTNSKQLPSWITVQPTSGGISPGPDGAIVNVTVSQANTSTDARSVTLTFQLTGDTSKSATVQVTQKGATPSITVSDSNVVFNADGSLA